MVEVAWPTFLDSRPRTSMNKGKILVLTIQFYFFNKIFFCLLLKFFQSLKKFFFNNTYSLELRRFSEINFGVDPSNQIVSCFENRPSKLQSASASVKWRKAKQIYILKSDNFENSHMDGHQNQESWVRVELSVIVSHGIYLEFQVRHNKLIIVTQYIKLKRI